MPARPSYFAFIQSFYGVTMGMLKYKVARQGQIIGEYDASSIQLLINAGNLMVTDHVWATGMDGWKQLRELGFSVSPPPLPYVPPSSPLSAQVHATGGKRPPAYFAWMVAALILPVIFSWRIIFDKTLGYSRGLKIFYALWILIGLVIGFGDLSKELSRDFSRLTDSSSYSRSSSYGTGTSSARTENLESKNAAFMATLTPEQRIAAETLQSNLRAALRDSFNVRDADKDGKLNRAEFMSTGLFKNDYQGSDFDRFDINKDGYVTFAEETQR